MRPRAALPVAVALWLSAAAAHADGEPVVVWPTLTPAGDAAGAAPHKPTDAEPTLLLRAQELDATLRDAVQDLGLALTLGAAGGYAREQDLLRAAQGSETEAPRWILSPRIEPVGDDSFVIRLVVVAPRGNDLRVRVETVKGADVSARGLVMLRDLLGARPKDDGHPCAPAAGAIPPSPTAAHSPGRAIFAANGALFGGFLAFSLQQAAISEGSASDPRVLYPLLLLGAGVGLGGTLLASTEWNVGAGDAWYLAAGAWWGTASGFFLASATNVQPLNQRYLYGAAGGLLGVSLATVALSRGPVDEGGAWLTHSGAAVGFLVGSAAELMGKGSLDRPPPLGQGIGIATGLIGAGLLAKFVPVPTSRVLLVDLGIGLGGLAGAAGASALVFDEVTPAKTRAFLGITAGAAVGGGALAYFLTRNLTVSHTAWNVWPDVGVLAMSPDGKTPAYGVGARGSF